MAENRGHAPQRDEPADPGSSRSRSSNGLFSLGRRVRDCTGDLLHVGQALCLTELRDEKWLRIQVTLLGLPGQSRPRCCYANPQSKADRPGGRNCTSDADRSTTRLQRVALLLCHTWIHMGARVGFAPTTFAL